MCHNRYIEYTLMHIGYECICYVEYNEYSFMYFITKSIFFIPILKVKKHGYQCISNVLALNDLKKKNFFLKSVLSLEKNSFIIFLFSPRNILKKQITNHCSFLKYYSRIKSITAHPKTITAKKQGFLNNTIILKNIF